MRTLAALLLVTSAACIQLPRQPLPTSEEGAWAVARDRMTRSGRIYDGLSTNAFVTAVYLPRQVRDARVARVAAWKVLTVAETQRMLDAEREDAAHNEEFLVALFTPTPADNDLDASNSIWRVAMVSEGLEDVLPESILMERTDSMMLELYPFIGDFDSVYRVRFPRVEAFEGRAFKLRLAGAKGRVDLDYGAAR